MSKPTNQPTNQPPSTLTEAFSRLTISESAVLTKMAEGKTNAQIAKELHKEVKTISNTIYRIGKRLQLNGKGNLRKWVKEQV